MESIGKYLKETRESKNISIETASKESKISLDHIKQIEADEFNKISGMTYLKGFLKQYGEYLGLDGNVLIDEYIKIYGNIDKGKDKISLISNYQRMELTLMSLQKWVPIVKKLILSIILLSIIFAGYKLMPSITNPLKNIVKINFTKTKQVSKPKENTKQSSSILNDIEAIEQKNTIHKKIRKTEVDQDGVLSTVTVEEKKAHNDKNIEIKAIKNVWLTIKIDNKLIMDGLLEEGETEKINDTLLVEITANNPANISIKYKKQEITDFKDKTSNSVIKIENGEIIIEN